MIVNEVKLRDFFAGQALKGILSNPKLVKELSLVDNFEGAVIEEASYKFAENMLKERKKYE